jgi:hypothetical protein
MQKTAPKSLNRVGKLIKYKNHENIKYNHRRYFYVKMGNE